MGDRGDVCIICIHTHRHFRGKAEDKKDDNLFYKVEKCDRKDKKGTGLGLTALGLEGLGLEVAVGLRIGAKIPEGRRYRAGHEAEHHEEHHLAAHRGEAPGLRCWPQPPIRA